MSLVSATIPNFGGGSHNDPPPPSSPPPETGCTSFKEKKCVPYNFPSKDSPITYNNVVKGAGGKYELDLTFSKPSIDGTVESVIVKGISGKSSELVLYDSKKWIDLIKDKKDKKTWSYKFTIAASGDNDCISPDSFSVVYKVKIWSGWGSYEKDEYFNFGCEPLDYPLSCWKKDCVLPPPPKTSSTTAPPPPPPKTTSTTAPPPPPPKTTSTTPPPPPPPKTTSTTPPPPPPPKTSSTTAPPPPPPKTSSTTAPPPPPPPSSSETLPPPPPPPSSSETLPPPVSFSTSGSYPSGSCVTVYETVTITPSPIYAPM